jgi:hypothetical protein
MIDKVLIFVIVTIGTTAFIMCGLKENSITSLEATIDRINANKARVETALLSQTQEIEKQAIDTQKRIEELQSIPPEIKYKTITKDVIKEIIITKEATCEDTKNLISNVRNIDINSL